MLLFYVRHGDPIYQPDSLTPLGRRQAEAVARRLALYGVDRIFSSTSDRAVQTAQPTCEILKKELTQLDFAHEKHVFDELSVIREDGLRTWAFMCKRTRAIFSSAEVRAMGEKWTEHPMLAEYHFEKGIQRVRRETDVFLASLGYERVPGAGAYRVVRSNDERVALFAHQGFGLAFLSCVLEIPYPVMSMHFDMSHTGMTAIHFREEDDGFARPCILTLSNDSHLYRDGLPTKYNNEIYF